MVVFIPSFIAIDYNQIDLFSALGCYISMYYTPWWENKIIEHQTNYGI